MDIASRQIVLGFCPDNYQPEHTFLFAFVGAEFHRGVRVRVNNPIQSFPPQGTVFVPKDLIPENFREGDAAAWDVEDQPDYAEKQLSSRYRAIDLVDAPMELVPVPWPSTDPSLRQYLQDTGLTLVPRRADHNVLLEFSDGLVARARLEPKAGDAGSFVVSAADLAHPLDAWPADKLFPTLSLPWRRVRRRFCTHQVPQNVTASLDLSTLEETLADAMRSGGLGSVLSPAPAELRNSSRSLRRSCRPLTVPGGRAAGSAWTVFYPRLRRRSRNAINGKLF